MKNEEKKHINLKSYFLVFTFLFLFLFILSTANSDGFNPEDNRSIGYEFLDNNSVVHIWNTQYDYFFEKDAGIQLTNHYNDYWSKNIFCIGYYNNDEWNKIKCSDELTNFNKNIQTDNLTYVNATLWKDIEYGGYDLRLGVNYYLGLDDENLSVSIYGKNIGIDIPFDLGFAWKIKDLEIPGVGEDEIEINDSVYSLSGSNDLLFKNMNESYFKVKDVSKFLRLDWDDSLNYAVKMYGDGNQSNFYVTLLVNAGLFSAGQEKSTTIKWIDADITIDNSVKTDLFGYAKARSLVWVSPTNGYVFYTETGSDLEYRKTEDGGATWGGPVTIEADTTYAFGVWYDKWTNGDSGNMIHISWMEVANSDIRYANLDTSDDTLANEVVAFDGASFQLGNWINHDISITKTIGGALYIAWRGDSNEGEHGFEKSEDDGATWSSKLDLYEANAEDTCLLVPGGDADTDDVWVIYHDWSADAISLKVYDQSGNTWSEAAITTSVENADYLSYDAVPRHSDNHVIVALWNAIDNAAADIEVWDITDAGTITQKTDVVTDSAESGGIGLMINQQNDDLYVGYMVAGVWQATTDVYYKKSGDGGANWDAAIQLSETTDDYNMIMSGTSVGGSGGMWRPIWFNDDLDDLMTTSIGQVTISVAETTAPNVIINSPTNTTYTTTNILLNVTATDGIAVANCNYSLDGGDTNVSMTNASTSVDNYNASIIASQGSTSVHYLCFDTLGNLNNTENVTFFVDSIIPFLNITFPINNSNSSNINLDVNFTRSDTNLAECWYSNDTNTINVSLGSCGNLTNEVWSDGNHNLTIWVNDTANNINKTSISFIIDSTAPDVIITDPQAINYANNNSIDLNYSVSDASTEVDTCWYNVFLLSPFLEAIGDTIIVDCLNTTFKLPSGDEDYRLTFYSNDSLNNLDTTIVNFGIRTNVPAVVLDYPKNNSYLNNFSDMEFNFTATDSDGLDTCELWGNWNSSEWHKNYTWVNPESAVQNTTKVNITEGDGIYKWNVWCNDTLDNAGWSTNNYTFIIDTINPEVSNISITTPANSQTFTFSFNATDTNLFNCFYSVFNSTGGIDTSVTENTSVPCNSAGNSETVSSYATYNLTIYANDSAGNINSSTLEFITSPTLPGGTTGGGGGTTIIITEGNWTMTSAGGGTSYEKIYPTGFSDKLDLYFENFGEQEREITLSCNNIEGELCQYISFEEPTFILPVIKDSQLEKTFTISITEEQGAEGTYLFNIVATDEEERPKSISVFVSLGGSIFQKIIGRLGLATAGGFPYALIVLPVLFVTLFLSVIIIPTKFPLKVIWVSLITILLPFFILYLI